MTYGITGATGQLGRLVINLLKAKIPAETIVALVRTPAKAADLGVAVRPFDYNSVDALEGSLTGIDTLLFISGSEVGSRIQQHKNVIEAAKQAGIKRILYTSLLRADTSPLSLAGEHKATEDAILASGIPFTILRNGWYTENYTNSIGGALAGGAFIGSAGSGRISATARADYAEAAVAALLSQEPGSKVYELAADDSFSLTELAAEVLKQTGKNLPYRDLSSGDYAAALAGFGLPEPLAQAIASWDVGASEGALFDDGHQLSTLIGHPTTPLAISVAEALKNLA